MAAPHVAGVAALLLQKNPSLSPNQVKQILTGTAKALSYNFYTEGNGRLDALSAITSETCITPGTLSLGADYGHLFTNLPI